jgi:hypothetical protein
VNGLKTTSFVCPRIGELGKKCGVGRVAHPLLLTIQQSTYHRKSVIALYLSIKQSSKDIDWIAKAVVRPNSGARRSGGKCSKGTAKEELENGISSEM